MESKYLVLLQELKNPVCSSSEQSPAREVISRLLEDALQAESTDHPDHPIFKPNTVRYVLSQRDFIDLCVDILFVLKVKLFLTD